MKLSGLTAIVSVLVVALSAGIVAACDKPDTPTGARASATGTCLGGEGHSGSAVARVTPAPTHQRARRMLAADLSLDCFDGSGPVRLTTITTPTVVNLWASWCPPCQQELPAIESFARHTDGQVTVIGVDTGDTRAAAGPTISARGLTYPMLYDRDQVLLHALGLNALPATLFIDGPGRVAGVYNGPALDEAHLTQLARQYLGVPR
ncbi:MAG TPA: TlpA disulfide reductase family protein [Micromonosporaceae bacterium]